MSDTHAVLNLVQLRCFVEAADAGTMTAAAERLRVTQSAISLAIGKLEDGLGTQLLVRDRSRGLSLTPAGVELLPQARSLLAHAADVREAAEASGRGLRGRLTIGCFKTVAPSVLPVLLESLGREHPGIELAYIEGPGPEIEAALGAGRCEIAILDEADIGPGLTHERLYTRRPYVVLPERHPLADARAITLEQLAPHPLVLLDVPPSDAYFLGLFAAAGLTPQVRHRASSIELVRSLVGRDQGYGLLASRPATSVSWEGRPLAERELAGEIEPVRICLAWPAGTRRTARARAFAAHCHRLLAAGPPS